MNLWTWPVVYGTASAVGLAAALLGDGWLDVVSWLTLAAPLAGITYAIRPSWEGSRTEPRSSSPVRECGGGHRQPAAEELGALSVSPTFQIASQDPREPDDQVIQPTNKPGG